MKSQQRIRSLLAHISHISLNPLAPTTRNYPVSRIGHGLLTASMTGLLAAAASVSLAVTLTLTPPAGDANRFDIQLELNESLLLRSSDSTTAMGTVDAALDWELVDGDVVVNGITVTDSAITFDDLTFNFVGGVLNVQGTGLGGEVTTPNPPSAVTAGIFDASDHELTINQGLFAVAGIITDNFDISTLPFSGSGTGDASLSLNEVSRTASEVIYDITMLFPVAFSDRVLDSSAGDDATMDIEVDGLVEAEGQLIAMLTAETSADYDGDDDVDGDDFLTWQRGNGIVELASPTNGDSDADGDVDAADLTVWENQFGGAVTATSAIPEPTTGLLLAVTLLAAGLARVPRKST